MEKHSRCINGICDNDMQYPELHENHSNVDGDMIMNILPKDRAVRAAWINAIFKDKKTIIQESLHTFVMASLLG